MARWPLESDSGVAGICTIVKTAAPDSTQRDPKAKYYDAIVESARGLR
ncbi:MAG TPA: hypothetical protein VGT98_08380 [Candidatus Elarobacter sp.]|nr:hypothetical protein [Candidatus Elarobacter sp.]